MSKAGFSVLIPVYNEATILPITVPMILEGLSNAEVVFVCNGCTDKSRAILESIVGDRAKILEVTTSGKAAAIRAGEAQLTSFPRFYVDADVRISGNGLTKLAAKLHDSDLELISPRLVADLSGATRLARLVSELWLALPHGQSDAFHNVLCVSQAGRRRWEAFPDVLADDAFITSCIPPSRRCIDRDVSATISLPRTLSAWTRVRARWARGERELRRLNIRVPRTPGQRGALVRMFSQGRVLAVVCYVTVTVISEILSWTQRPNRSAWFQDYTTRGLRL